MNRSLHCGLLILSIALVAALAPGLANLRLDNSFEIWFPETDPALVTYQQYIDEFGSDEVVVLVVAPADEQALSDASLQALEGLLSGEKSSYHCDFFSFDEALIRPAPEPRIPILVGGRSNAAIRRTAGRTSDCSCAMVACQSAAACLR